MRLHDSDGLAEGFLELARDLYRDDPAWLPEDLEPSFAPGSPWLERGRAHTFCVPGAARVSVFRPHGLEIDGAPAAFFGHFESAGDRRVEALVLRSAQAWAREAGALRLYGPVDLSPAVGHCLRLDRTARRFFDEPYNPSRYAAALLFRGFREYRRYAGVAGTEPDLRRLAARAPLADGHRIVRMTPEVWEARRDELRTLANVVFAGNFGFTPLSAAEFDATFDAGWVRRLDPDLSVLALAPDGRLAGFGPYVPDWMPLLAQGAALRDLSYAEDAPALARFAAPAAVARAGGVAPAHQRLGLAAAMASFSARRAVEKGLRIFYGRAHVSNPVLRVFKDLQTTRRSYALYVVDAR